MKIVVIGSGGRESAIAWACRRHGHEVTIRPTLAARHPTDVTPDLVIVGPETALADGVADECRRRSLPCFGPTAEVAKLESSKGYARQLATALGLPSPRFMVTASAAEATEWWRQLG